MSKISLNNKNSVVKIFSLDPEKREEAYATKLVDELLANMNSTEEAATTIFELMKTYSGYMRNINTEWHNKKVAGGLNHLATEVLKLFGADFILPDNTIYIEHKVVKPKWISLFESSFERITADVANDHYFVYRVVKITLASVLCYAFEKQLLSVYNIFICIMDAIRELSKSENNCY